MKIGVLALQGDFREHAQMLRQLGVETREVRSRADLEGIDGLIIPGGESTTIGRLLDVFGLLEDLRAKARAGLPIYGTCAGMIVLAREVAGRAKLSGEPQPLLGVMDLRVRRNAFGRQVDSFEADLPMPALGDKPFHAVFIRAPLIEEVGPGVEALARLEDGTVVAARQGNLLVTAFHPELTGDPRVHDYFLRIVRGD